MFLGSSRWANRYPVPNGHATAGYSYPGPRRGGPWPSHLAGAIAASNNKTDAEPVPVPEPRAAYIHVANPEPNTVTNPGPDLEPGGGPNGTPIEGTVLRSRQRLAEPILL